MKVINFKVFDGRSIYSHKKSIKINLDLDGYEKVITRNTSNFNENLVILLPELTGHQCNLQIKGGLMNRLSHWIYLHHLCGHISIALQNKIGIDVSFCS